VLQRVEYITRGQGRKVEYSNEGLMACCVRCGVLRCVAVCCGVLRCVVVREGRA